MPLKKSQRTLHHRLYAKLRQLLRQESAKGHFLKHKYAGAPKSKSTVRHRSVAGPAQIPVWAMMKALKTVFKPQNKAGGSNPGGRGQGNCPHFLHKVVLCTFPSLLQSGRPPVREYDHSTYSMSRETFLITCLVELWASPTKRQN